MQKDQNIGKLHTIRTVIFDMDGIIFDSERLFIEAWFRLPEAADLPGLLPLLKDCIGITRAHAKELFLARYGEDFPFDLYRDRVTGIFWELAPGGILPMLPGVREILAYLKDCGMPAVLATSTHEAQAKKELADVGVLPYFSIVLGGDHVKNSKPAPDLFLAAAERAGVSPENCLVLEDSYNGIRAAHAAGMMPVMVPNLLEPTEEMQRLALAILPSLYEARTFLQEILQSPL